MEFDIPTSWHMGHPIWEHLNAVTTPENRAEVDEYGRQSLEFIETLKPRNLTSNLSITEYELRLTKFKDSYAYREIFSSSGGNATIYEVRSTIRSAANKVVDEGKDAILLARARLQDAETVKAGENKPNKAKAREHRPSITLGRDSIVKEPGEPG